MEWHSIYLGIITVLFIVYIFFKWKFSYWKNRGVPTLLPFIPYGNFRGVTKTIGLKDLLDTVYKRFKNETPISGIYMLFSPIAVAIDLNVIKDILIRDSHVFQDRGMFYNEESDPLSANMFALDGQKWKSIRQRLTPTFTSGKMKFMFSTVVDVADRFVEKLKVDIESDSELEMKELLARFTTDVIGECAFGIECNSLKDPNTEFRNYGRATFKEPRHSRVVQSLLHQFPGLGKKLGMKIIRDDITAFFMRVVRETVEYRERNNVRRDDFMDLLIDIKNGKSTKEFGSLTMEEITAQGFLFFLAGFETSSTTLAYTLYELALNEDVQGKAREEIVRVLDEHKGQLTYEAIMSMPYADQIINETLRKYPVIPTLSRRAKENYQVSNTKIVLEKGTKVLIPVFSIQRDPEIYPNPEAYDPDRFSPDEMQKRHPMSFLPFGDGPRNCIGLRFGRMQTKIGLVNLLKNFYVRKSAKTPVSIVFENGTAILTSKGGLHLCLENISK